MLGHVKALHFSEHDQFQGNTLLGMEQEAIAASHDQYQLISFLRLGFLDLLAQTLDGTVRSAVTGYRIHAFNDLSMLWMGPFTLGILSRSFSPTSWSQAFAVRSNGPISEQLGESRPNARLIRNASQDRLLGRGHCYTMPHVWAVPTAPTSRYCPNCQQ